MGAERSDNIPIAWKHLAESIETLRNCSADAMQKIIKVRLHTGETNEAVHQEL